MDVVDEVVETDALDEDVETVDDDDLEDVEDTEGDLQDIDLKGGTEFADSDENGAPLESAEEIGLPHR